MSSPIVVLQALRRLSPRAFSANLLKPKSQMHQHVMNPMVSGSLHVCTRPCSSWSHSAAEVGTEFGKAAMSSLLRKGLDRYLGGNATTRQDPIDVEFVSPKCLGMKKWAITKPFETFVTELENSGAQGISEHDFNRVSLTYFANAAAPTFKAAKPYTIHTDDDFHAYLNLHNRPMLRAWVPRKSRFALAKEGLSKLTAPFLNRLAKLPIQNKEVEISDAVAKFGFSEYDKKTLLLEEKGISKNDWDEFVEDFKDDEELPDKVAAQMKRASKTERSERARFGLRMKNNKCEGAFMQRLCVQKEGDKISYQIAYYSVGFQFEDPNKRLTACDTQLIEEHTRLHADIFFKKEAEQKLLPGSGIDTEEEKK